MPTRPIAIFSFLLVFMSFLLLSVSFVLKIIICCSVIFFSLILLLFFKKIRKLLLLIFVAILISTIIPMSHYLINEHYSNNLIDKNFNSSVLINGIVKEYKGGESYSAFTLEIEKINGKKLFFSQKASFFVYGKIEACVNSKFSIIGQLKHLENKLNDDFDMIKYSKSNGIFIVIDSKDNIDIQTTKIGFIENIQNYIKNTLYKFVGSSDYSAKEISKAIVLGDKTDVPKSIIEDFRLSGINHILCVSGLHLSIMLVFIVNFLLFLNIGKGKSYAIICFIGIFYMIIADFTPSICRSVITNLIFYIGFFFGRVSDPINSLLIAAFVLCFFSPYTVFDIGAQLSFMATLGILSSAPIGRIIHLKIRKSNFLKYILSTFTITIFAIIFTIPITANISNEISLIAPIVNLIVIYPVSICLVFLFLIVILSPLKFLTPLINLIGFVSKSLLDFVTFTAELFSSFRYSVIIAEKSELVLFVFAIFIVLMVLVLSFSRKETQILTTICIFSLSSIFIICSIFININFEKSLNVYYYRSYKNEAISVKLKENGYLFIALNQKPFTETTKKPLLDKFGENNYYLPMALESTDLNSIINVIDNFENEYNISYLCLNSNDKLHNQLNIHYKNYNNFKIIDFTDTIKFENLTLNLKTSNEYAFLNITYSDHNFGILKSNELNEKYFEAKHYDKFIFSPIKNKRKSPITPKVNALELYTCWYSSEENNDITNLRYQKFLDFNLQQIPNKIGEME